MWSLTYGELQQDFLFLITNWPMIGGKLQNCNSGFKFVSVTELKHGHRFTPSVESLSRAISHSPTLGYWLGSQYTYECVEQSSFETSEITQRMLSIVHAYVTRTQNM